MWLLSFFQAVLLSNGLLPSHRTPVPSTAPRLALRLCHPANESLIDIAGDNGCLYQQICAPSIHAEAPAGSDYVRLHFLATLADGTIIYDTRESRSPVEVRLGMTPSEMVPGWELAIPLMQVGEVGRLICTPPYGFGEQGAPPRIPPNATIKFEIEMLSIRDLMSSNNTEEVNMADRYATLIEEQEQDRVHAARSVEIDDNDCGERSYSERQMDARDCEPSRSGMGADTEVSASAEVSKGGGRAWIPTATRVEGEHALGYTWRETDAEIEICIPLPEGASLKDICVHITTSSVKVEVCGESKLEGRLVGRVVQEDCNWCLAMPSKTMESPVLQLDLMKLKRVDTPLWGYVLASDLDAAQRFEDDDQQHDG